MAKERKIVVTLDVNAQITGNELKEFEKTFEAIRTSPLISAESKSSLKELESQLEAIKSTLDPTSENFINQKDVEGAQKVYDLVKSLYSQLKSFKKENLGNLKLNENADDIQEVNKELDKTKAKITDIVAKTQETLGLENMSQAQNFLEGKPVAKGGQRRINELEFSSDFGTTAASAGSLFSKQFKDPEKVAAQLREAFEATKGITDQSERLAAIEPFVKKGKDAEEYQANVEKVSNLLDNFAEKEERYANKTSVAEKTQKETKAYKEAEKAIEANEAKREELIASQQAEIEALQKLNQAKEDEKAARKQVVAEQQIESQTADQLEAKRQRESDSVRRLIDRYLSFTAVLALTKRLVNEAYRALDNLDKAFTEMAIVTSYTTKEIWSFYDSFQAIAKISGFTTAEVAGVTAEYLKQGENLQDSLKLTEAAAKAAQVAGISTADSVRYLTSAVRGYRLEAEDAMFVSDKFAAVAAATATDYDGMATAMSKVAAQAYANGVEMDNLMGLLSTAMDVTQEAPENIGTAFKTIFARMSQIADYGKALEDGVDLNRVETALKQANVALRDTEGNFRNLDDVLIETGANWNKLNSTQKAYITNTLAGTRQQTRLLAVFENYDLLLENIETSQDAAGATNAQQAKYMESLAASTNRVSIAWESLITNITGGTQVFKGALDLIARLIGGLSDTLSGPLGPAIKIIAVTTALGGLISAGGKAVTMLNSFMEKNKLVGGGLAHLAGYLQNLSKGLEDVAIKQATAKVAGDKLTTTNLLTKLSAELASKGLAKMATAATFLQTAVPVILGISLAVTAVMTVFNMFNKSRTLEDLNEELTKLEGNLYNLNQDKVSIEKLIDEYEELNNKVVKTNEDLERMASIIQALKDFDPDNEYTFGEGTTLFSSEVERYFRDLEDERNKLFAEARETELEILKKYKRNREGIEGDMSKVSSAIIWKTVGEQKEAYEALDALDKQYLSNYIARQLDPSNLVAREKTAWGTPTTKKGPRSFEEVQAEIEPFIPILNQLRSMLTDDLSGKQAAGLIQNLVPEEEDLALLKAIVPELESILLFADSGLSLGKIKEYSDLLTIVTNNSKDLSDTTKRELVDVMKQGYGPAIEYITENMDEMGLSMIDVIGIASELNSEMNKIDFQDITSGMKNLESAAETISNFSIDEAFTGESLQTILDLMTQFPDQAEAMIDSIERTGEIDASVKEAMLQSGKDQLIANLKLNKEKIQNDLDNAKEELKLLQNLAKDDVAIKQLASSGKVDISNATVKDILNGYEEMTTEYAKAMTDMVGMARRVGEQIKIALAGGKVDGSISSSYSSSFSETDFANKAAEALKAKIDSGIASQKSLIKSYEAQLRLNDMSISKIEALDLQSFGASKDKGKASSGGGKSAASEKAEYYLGVLNKLYVAEQRVRAAELFSERNNQAIEYAKSIEALGDSYEGQRKGYESSAKLLEEQYALYAIMGEQQEHLIATLEDYQKGLKEGLDPALLKTFKIIDGRIIPISEEYGKLNAENMEILDKFAESFNNYADSIDDATQASIDYKVAQNELLADMRDAVIEWQEVMIEAIKNEEKKYLDSFKRMIDANKDYLNERKKLYQDSFSAEDTDQKLAGIEEERLSLTEKIAALEGAHDIQSLKRKEDYRKQLDDLNKQYTELTLQYNRDAFMQRIDDQIAYQDEVYAKEEEAYNERISDAQWLEDRIADISRDARIQALIDQGIHNMTLDELIAAGYITHEQATAAGLNGIQGTVSEWSTAEKEALGQHFSDNTEQFENAWGDKTADGQDGAEKIVKAAIDNIIDYLEEHHPEIEGATSAMKQKIVADWTAMTKAASEYTKNFDGITLGAPDHTALSKALKQITTDIKNAADAAEREYARIKAAQNKASSGSGGSSGGGSGGTGGGSGGSPTITYRYGTSTGTGANRKPNATSDNKTAAVNQWGGSTDIYRFTYENGAFKRGSALLVHTARRSTGGGGGGAGAPSFSVYATGGTTERTGFHWLDGEPGKQERVLSAGQDKEFQNLLATLATESDLRTSSYVSLASLDQMNQLVDSLDLLGMKLVTSDQTSTRTLANELQEISDKVEEIGRLRVRANPLSTLTVNKKL